MIYHETEHGILYNGESLEVLRTLPDNSVNCCVTSPPYWGLRDYGCNGQLGLERTPEEYVSNMVQLFREVRRVLRKDGTLWLNLGDSYYPHNGSRGNVHDGGDTLRGRDNKYQPAPRFNDCGLKSKDLVGIPWRVAFALQQPYEYHTIKAERDRAYIAGLVDGEGCITILKTKSSHCDSQSYPPIVQVRMCDIEAIDYFAMLLGAKRSEAELYNSQKSANQRPAYSVKATSQKAMDLIADIYPYLRVKRPQAIVAYNHQLFRNKTNYQQRNQEQVERESFCKELINKMNQRQPYTIPSWMVEPQFKVEQGYYLRQDLIWHKPNPMPESVKDRCTKSHEYIFLLSKSARYYYDNEAVKEPVEHPEITHKSQTKTKGQINAYLGNAPTNLGRCGTDPSGRNKRSVWTVTTKPFKEAHFATFPRDLIRPMIQAGCPEQGIVLDPFMGSGTTAIEAIYQGKRYIGIDLNQDYCAMAAKRIEVELDQQVIDL